MPNNKLRLLLATAIAAARVVQSSAAVQEENLKLETMEDL